MKFDSYKDQDINEERNINATPKDLLLENQKLIERSNSSVRPQSKIIAIVHKKRR